MLVALFTILLVGVIAEPWPGKCPEVTLHEKIDLKKFLGKWYMSHIYDNMRNQTKCMRLIFEIGDNSLFINSTAFDTDGGITYTDTIRLDRSADATNDGQLIVNIWRNDIVEQFPLNILSTDYTDYAILYFCRKSVERITSPTAHDVTFWIITKQHGKLEGEKLQKVENALSHYSSLAEGRSLTIDEFSLKDLCNINW